MGVTKDVIVAVDGGGSKTDVVVASVDGTVLARERGPGCSQHDLGPAPAVAVIDSIVRAALLEADVSPELVRHAGCYLTAIDLPDEQAHMTELVSGTGWGRRSVVVDNDLFAMLRAGTAEPSAAVVVCGTGINGLAVHRDGRVARILALGRCSGDWGGGGGLVEEALWLAARAHDGRSEPTGLLDAVLRWAGAATIDEVSVAVQRRQVSPWDWRERVPEIFRLAEAGDAAAMGLVRAQGSEIGVLAASLVTRLGLLGEPVPLVLGGGIVTSGSALLMDEVTATLRERAPLARVTVLRAPPIDGALQLALQHAG